jgi:hypothetical protein
MGYLVKGKLLPILWCKAHREIWIPQLAKEIQQQQHIANILVLKFMIGIKYRKFFWVCQGVK